MSGSTQTHAGLQQFHTSSCKNVTSLDVILCGGKKRKKGKRREGGGFASGRQDGGGGDTDNPGRSTRDKQGEAGEKVEGRMEGFPRQSRGLTTPGIHLADL